MGALILALQITLGLFDASATNPNTAPVIVTMPLASQCGQAKAPETVTATGRPTEIRWDDADPARDCVAPVSLTVSARGPFGYRAAIRSTGAFGALSNRFLAAAQTVPALAPGVAFRVALDHDGANTSGYRLLVDGVQVGGDLPMTALAGGVVTATVPGQMSGPHAISLVPVNASGAATGNPVLTVDVVVPLPRAGSNLRRVP
jgi:hypothetical protein